MAVQRHQVHRAFPRDQVDLVVRVGIRRQRAPWQEVLRAADRLVDGARRGMVGRTHAHPQADVTRGPDPLHHGGIPQRLWEDQPGHASADRAGLEVERLATISPGCVSARTAACTPLTPRRVSSASHREPALSNQNAVDTFTNTLFTNTGLTDDGDVWWEGLGRRRRSISSTGRVTIGRPVRRSRRRTRIAALPPPSQCPSSPTTGKTRGRAHLGLLVRRPSRDDRALGERGLQLDTGCSWAPPRPARDRGRRPHGRRTAPRPVRHAAVLRLQHGRLLGPLAIVWPSTRPGETARRSTTSTGSARALPALSFGPASGRTAECLSGCLGAWKVRARRSRRPSVICPPRKPLDLTGLGVPGSEHERAAHRRQGRLEAGGRAHPRALPAPSTGTCRTGSGSCTGNWPTVSKPRHPPAIEQGVRARWLDSESWE